MSTQKRVEGAYFFVQLYLEGKPVEFKGTRIENTHCLSQPMKWLLIWKGGFKGEKSLQS